MKNIIKTTLLATSLTLAFTVSPTTVKADMISDVIGTVASKGSAYLCRKGDAKKGIFSGRSFSGKLCEQKEFAAIMEKTCPGKDGYDSSGCAKKAKKALQGKSIQTILSGLGGKLKDLAQQVKAVN